MVQGATLQKLIHVQAARPEVTALLTAWPRLAQEVIAEAVALQAIPAPTFAEHARARAVETRLAGPGLQDVRLDDAGNVVGCTPGADSARPALMISAHLDTVFSSDTDLAARHDPQHERIIAPGLGDNGLGLAAMLTLAREIGQRQITPPCDIWWVATVCEEGLGDLRGMRYACQRLAGRLGLAVVIEGLGLGRIYHAGLSVRRLRVTVRGPGGHSWLHRERPSAIHHLLKLGAALADRIAPPADSRSILNIGLISGGTSINSRAAQASLSIDLRSEEAATLARLEKDVIAIAGGMPHHPDLTVSTEVIGDRPGTRLSPSHPLVQAARGVLDYVNWGSPMLETGSTDANIPLALGIPTVCIGITSGGDAHTIGEYINTAPVATGMQQLTLLALLAAEHTYEWNRWNDS